MRLLFSSLLLICAFATSAQPEPIASAQQPFLEVGPYAIADAGTGPGFVITTTSESGDVRTVVTERVDSLATLRANAIQQAMQIYAQMGQAQVDLWLFAEQGRDLERLVDQLDSTKYVEHAKLILAPRYVDTWVIRYQKERYRVDINERWKADLTETKRVVVRPYSRTYIQIKGLTEERWVDLYSRDGDSYEGYDAAGERIRMTRK